MPARTLLTALLLTTACIVPEKGIDNTRVVGTLRVDADRMAEPPDNNDLPLNPTVTEPLHFGYRVLNGVVASFAYDEPSNSVLGDVDYWTLVTPIPRGVDDENQIALEITLDDPAARARVWVKNIDELGGLLGNEPTDVNEADFVGSTTHTFTAEQAVNYVVGIGGIEGTGPTDYRIAIMGQHPNDANLLVGAYSSDDPADRGGLLGGTNAKPFTSVDGYAFESWYEMLFIRDFETDEDGDVITLDENVKSAFIWAGTWANLAQRLPAGTWYSRKPVAVDLKKKGPAVSPGTPPVTALPEDTGAPASDEAPETVPLIRDTPKYPTVTVEETVVVNKIAPAVIGQSWDEVEPNNAGMAGAVQYGEALDTAAAQDLGVLSGPGFVDLITNAGITDNGEGYWTGEDDTYKFQVPEPLLLGFNLSWMDPGMDLDIVLLDGDGNMLDQGYYGFPEIPEVGTEVLQPGQDYYLGVMLWVGIGTDGAEIPYGLSLEQTAP